MSTQVVQDTLYEIKQGKNVVILTDQTLTIQVRYDDDPTFFATIASSGTDPSYTIPFLKESSFKVTALVGGTKTRFDYSPSQG